MAEEKNTEKSEEYPEIKIDYDDIDVAGIMAQIKKRIASRPKMPSSEKTDLQAFPPSSVTPKPEQPTGAKAKFQKLLTRFMKPFAPVIKFLVFPVHQELRQTVLNLHQTNKRVDHLDERFLQLDKRVNQIEKAVNQRIDFAFEEIGRTKEYIKILHSLSHNIVVEMTKLKIEVEQLKVKTRVMEKDFEFLGQKEKALEGEIFK